MRSLFLPRLPLFSYVPFSLLLHPRLWHASRRFLSSSSPSQDDSFSIPLADYETFRRSVCGGFLNYKALLVDAAGTLIVPAQPAAKVYQEIGKKYGVQLSEEEILARYRLAYAKPWCKSRLRFEDDARPFWRHIVELSTGCKDPCYAEELYQYYTNAEAWKLVDPNADKIFAALRSAGIKLAVVSNFDTRLRPLLKAMQCYGWFDALAVSAEVGAEKPNPAIFWAACELLDVKPEEAVHVGDDRRNDIWGARDAGCDAWLWGQDVNSFLQVAEKIGIRIDGGVDQASASILDVRDG